MSLKRFLEEARKIWGSKTSPGTMPMCIETYIEAAYAEGVKEGKARQRRSEVRPVPEKPEGWHRCEFSTCVRKATWDVCRSNGMGTRRCGRHNKGEGLTLKMYRIR